jgi:polar amino acid transport system substrate-binding protein
MTLKRIGGVVILVALAFGLGSSAAQGEPTTVTLGNLIVAVGQTGTVVGRIDCAADGCTAFDIQIRFDPAILRVDSAQIGPYLGTEILVVQNKIDNADGTIRLAAVVLGAWNAPTDDTLFTLTVTGLIPGMTALSVISLDVGDVIGNPIDAVGVSGVVAVNASPGPAPTEEATEEPTAEPTEEATAEPTEEPTREGPVVDLGVVTVGMNAEYSPMEYVDENGNIVGFDADLTAALAQRAGFDYELVNTRWDGIFVALAAGEFDMVISSATITEEREDVIDFSAPYFNAGQMIAVRAADAPFIQGPEDLAGLRVGVQAGTTGDIYATDTIAGAEILRYDEITLAFQALRAGEVDAVVNDGPVSADYIAKNPELDAVLVGSPLTQEFYGIAVQPDRPELLDAVNAALAAIIADGTYRDIYVKWFGVEPDPMFMPPATAGDTQAGERLFVAECAACHSSAMMTVSAPPTSDSVYFWFYDDLTGLTCSDTNYHFVSNDLYNSPPHTDFTGSYFVTTSTGYEYASEEYYPSSLSGGDGVLESDNWGVDVAAVPSGQAYTVTQELSYFVSGEQVSISAATFQCDAQRTLTLVSIVNQVKGSGVGPNLDGIGARAATRVSDLSAVAYLRESILDPGAYIVEGYSDLMPSNYGSRFTQQELDALVAYLLEQ